jgi:hypothetical protein
MKHWGFNIEYSQQYELILSGNRVFCGNFNEENDGGHLEFESMFTSKPLSGFKHFFVFKP